ncbi:HAD-IA family hydrolase, partial [Cytobacillus oceanisediminis]|nr:HAD-IA family hydrolase [Cytobacillus oceanisediminis]
MMFENKLYPNIPLLLKSLKEQGYILVVATSKPTVFAEQILKHFNIDQYFELIVGSNLDGTRASKTEIIQYILEIYNNHKLGDFIMIGDRKHDIIGAKNGLTPEFWTITLLFFHFLSFLFYRFLSLFFKKAMLLDMEPLRA